MVPSGLNASELTLLNFEPGDVGANRPGHATVYATGRGVAKLRKKVEEFETKDRKKRDGSVGRPFNADLVQSIGAIVEAGLRALWRSPAARFPIGSNPVPWELWLDRTVADRFIDDARNLNIAFEQDRLEFPEDVVVIATAAPEQLALAVRRLIGLKAIAAPTTTADFFDAGEPLEQVEWVEHLLARTRYEDVADPSFITLLDRGVSRAHPLIAPAIDPADRHAAQPGWAVDDLAGHGTQMAGLALFGDLTPVLQGGNPITITQRLESSKIIPDAGANPHHLLGAITRYGINYAEAVGQRRRTFTMATTTDADTPHDGAPTSWSTEIDQLSAGVSGEIKTERLILVSSGNTDQNLFTNNNYLAVCDDVRSEIESPAQAWNALSIGAYTEKSVLPPEEPGAAIAPIGDLSPSSRTASWSSQWPIKPDVVLEGGNWVTANPPPPMKHAALSLLTTDRRYPARSFSTIGETSAATALAARAISNLWADYPDLWPETVRALFVSSARWTPQMLTHLPRAPRKQDYAQLFKRYGFGVPDMTRARRSASNAFTLIVQDTIVPYRAAEGPSRDHVHNEMKVFPLPWPVNELRRLGNHTVTLRVALSTFVAPNPAEPARGSKFRYASHNLRFKLQRANENEAQFLARISEAAEQPDELAAVDEDDGWDFGRNRRDVGSLHIDQLTCRASDLARRNILAVHPVAGWWKNKKTTEPERRVARFSLIVEIDAGQVEAELHAEVLAAIEVLNLVHV